MDKEKRMVIKKYVEMKINGMHYVRKLNDNNKVFSGVLVIDNYNKPVKRVYEYLKYLYTTGGYGALNSRLRVAYDLCYFLDFMMFNNLTEEKIKYEDISEFLQIYLLIVDDKFKVDRSIQRSMLKVIPILEVYRIKNIKVINKMNIGLDMASKERILNNVKKYLVFLGENNIAEVNLKELFEQKVKSVYRENELGNRTKDLRYYYSIKGHLKKTGINSNRNKINPIEVSKIFEPDEEKNFFNHIENIQYKVLFNLLNNTGLRISEALGLKLISYKKSKGNIDWIELDSDVKLKSNNENIWEVLVIPREDSPPDLRIKFDKMRRISFADNTLNFRNLLEDYIMYREYLLKKKKRKHEYLFVNNRGERLRYDSVYKEMNNTLLRCEMECRIGELTPHSFRHTFATKWIKNSIELGIDKDLELLAEQLGHSSSEVTKRTYYHIFEASKKELLEKIEKENHYFNGEE